MRVEVSRREQEIMQMATKMKTLEEQHQDYQKHIAVLKESLCAKEEHYTMLQTDVSSAHHMANRKVKAGKGASMRPMIPLLRTKQATLSPQCCAIILHFSSNLQPFPFSSKAIILLFKLFCCSVAMR